ncbi:MAG: hypothetical protein CM15mP62_20100 [Rhodospirillaceae bacterium]|nr:MAG: hypothetical protein CM15mP62_20100 [Rhodospirillaceae bacterium]
MKETEVLLKTQNMNIHSIYLTLMPRLEGLFLGRARYAAATKSKLKKGRKGDFTTSL